MKLCFHHQDFDIDVSSGTVHALYQWFELLLAFGISECAIVNTTSEKIPLISSDILVHEFNSFSDFEIAFGNEKFLYVEKGGPDYRSMGNFSSYDWILIGGVEGFEHSDAEIPTGNSSLYPREAAAIILSRL